MCLLNEMGIGKKKEKTTEKGMEQFSFQKATFLDGDGRKHPKGLSQNGKTTERDQKSHQCQPQMQVVGGLAQKICSVGHFQKTAEKSVEDIGGKGQKEQQFR